MKVVGVRELKNGLSRYLREVKAGERILVSDRGQVVAELVSPYGATHDPDLPPGLVDLARRGLVRLGGKNDPSLYKPLPRLSRRINVQELLDEIRGDR